MGDRELNAYLEAASEAAKRGAVVLEQWRQRFAVQEKGRFDLVTEADVAAQEAIQSFLHTRFPSFNFLGEESKDTAPIPNGKPTWIVDPLDGTTNYVHDCPIYAVSIGLEIEGELVAGVVFDPSRNELFRAAQGCGAWCNGRRLKTSTIATLNRALLSTGFPPDMRGHEQSLEIWNRLSFTAQALRRTGSTALNLAYVAAGRHDGFWTHQAFPWDAAAGVVLVREAGGTVTRLDGSKYDVWQLDMIASNGPLHTPMIAAIGAP